MTSAASLPVALDAGYARSAVPPPPSDDPFPLAALLRAAVEAHCIATGATHGAVAARARIRPQVLSRAMKAGYDADPRTVRALCRALGLRVVLVPVADEPAPPDPDPGWFYAYDASTPADVLGPTWLRSSNAALKKWDVGLTIEGPFATRAEAEEHVAGRGR